MPISVRVIEILRRRTLLSKSLVFSLVFYFSLSPRAKVVFQTVYMLRFLLRLGTIYLLSTVGYGRNAKREKFSHLGSNHSLEKSKHFFLAAFLA